MRLPHAKVGSLKSHQLACVHFPDRRISTGHWQCGQCHPVQQAVIQCQSPQCCRTRFAGKRTSKLHHSGDQPAGNDRVEAGNLAGVFFITSMPTFLTNCIAKFSSLKVTVYILARRQYLVREYYPATRRTIAINKNQRP